MVLVDYLRRYDIIAINYIDDLAVIGNSEQDMRAKLRFVIEMFAALGYYLSVDKITWEPTQKMEFLGIGLDNVKRCYYFSDKKCNKLKTITRYCLDKHWVKIVEIQKVLGYLTHLKIAQNFHGPVAHALVLATMEESKSTDEQFIIKEGHTWVKLNQKARNELKFWNSIDLKGRFHTFDRKEFIIPNTTITTNECTDLIELKSTLT